jgi:hypothetical protein
MKIRRFSARDSLRLYATEPMPLIAGVLLGIWFVTGVIVFSTKSGDDLSALYFAARFMADGRIGHVFSHDPVFFDMVADPAWDDEAKATGFAGFAHPFVQAPLWAWIVTPLATNLSFPQFNAVFLIINMAGAIGALVLAIVMWQPRLLAPIPLAVLITLVSLSKPFRHNFSLNQTQALVLFLIMLAVFLAQRRRPAIAGAALALASLIKILPVALAAYWLVSGRRAAALWTGAFLTGAAALSVVVIDPALNAEYLRRVSEISHIVVMGINNQSFMAWLLNGFRSALLDWGMAPLPDWVRTLNWAVAGIIVAAFALRLRHAPTEHRDPVATTMILLVTTVFAPIAWTHYYLVLSAVSVVILRLYGSGTGQEWTGWVLVGIIWLLNTAPIAPPILFSVSTPWAWVHIYSGLLTLAVLYAAPSLSARRIVTGAKERQALT